MRVFANAQTRQSLLISHTQDTCIEVSRNEGACVSSLMHRLVRVFSHTQDTCIEVSSNEGSCVSSLMHRHARVFSSRIQKIHVLKCRETRIIRVFANAQAHQSLLFSHTQDTCIEVSRNEGSCVSSLMHRLARVFSSRLHKIHVLKCRDTKDHACVP